MKTYFDFLKTENKNKIIKYIFIFNLKNRKSKTITKHVFSFFLFFLFLKTRKAKTIIK